eukprot:s153_g11.t1
MELASSVQGPVARAHAARIHEPRGAPDRGIQAATQRKRFATAIGFGISLNLAWAGQAQARSRSVRKAHGQGRHGRREVLSIGVVTPLVVPLAAKAEAEPPTVSKKVSEGVYIFDQAYGIPGLGVGANIPIRMTVLSLEGGGYLVYNPCHPTVEAMQMLKDFGLTDVRYIVCGTVAIEHKYYAPQWAQLFPKAEVWISPRTFSWPVDFGPYVPVGGFSRSTPLQKIPKDASLAPWSSKGIDHLQLTVDYAPRTVFEETVLFHKPSGSFVCTDMLIGLSDEPPEILTLSPYKEGLLWFSRNEPLEEVDVSSPKTLKDGYQKSVLLLNNINPRSLLSVAAGDLAVPEQLGLASKAPQKELGYFGWCNWQASDSPCAKLDDRLLPSKGSKTFDCRPGWRGEWTRLAAGVEGTGFQVPSFVAELQVSRDPETLNSFAKEISRRWPGIKKVISSHFSSPLPASSENVSKAISAVCRGPPGPAARAADLSAILNFRDYLEENDLIYKPIHTKTVPRHDLEDLQRRLETADAGILSELTEQLGRIKAALVCVQGETAPLLETHPDCSDFKDVATYEMQLRPLGFKRCPACQLACEKQDPLSCDHITCVCGHEFCWMCGEDRRVIKAHDNSYHHKRCPFYEPCDETPRLEKNCPVCQATGVPCLRPPQAHAARRAAIRQQALGLEVRRLREGMEQSDGAIITEKTETLGRFSADAVRLLADVLSRTMHWQLMTIRAVQRPEHPFNLEALSQLLCGGPLASCCRVLNSDPPARR